MGNDAVFLGPGEGRDFTVGLDNAQAKIEAAATGDSFSLIEYEASAGAPGPPLHVHRVVSELFYMLDGEVEFRADGRTQRLGKGSVAFIPPGIPHTFSNVGSGVAKWVGIFSPGRYMALVEGIGKALPADGGPPDGEKMAALFAEWDTEVVPEG